MINQSSLKYLKHESIDSGKWNNCIEQASNSRIYANDWHLDRTAVIWDALVLGDYEFVMPLPIRKKWGISYIYQPLFSQQLGIYPSPPKKISTLFYKKLFEKIRYADIHLNSLNVSDGTEEQISFIPRKNYLLELNQDYKTLSNHYTKNTRRNISKARKNNLSLIAGIRLEDYMAFKQKNLVASVSKKDLEKLKSLIAFGQYKGFGEVYGVYSPDNKLCAAVYFCRWKERVIYLNAVADGLGKELGATYFLVDNFIQANAGKNMVLDFEGSMVPGVARFYRGFGAAPEMYFRLKFNRLPLPLRWLKR